MLKITVVLSLSAGEMIMLVPLLRIINALISIAADYILEILFDEIFSPIHV